MNIDQVSVRERCTDTVFERGKNYRDDDRVQRLERFDDVVTAAVHGSDLYDVAVNLGEDDLDARCTYPYTGPVECKHVVAVLLDIVRDPPADESERVDAVLEDVPLYDLQVFIRDALAENPPLRERFLARFGEERRSVDTYRAAVETLFEQHTQDYPLVTSAIDFSHFFDLADRYRTRERYLAAATVYRALFETIDDNTERINAAYDHYATTLRTALDGYVECILAADPSDGDFEQYAAVLEDRVSEHGVHNEVFRRGLDDLEAHR